MLNLPRRLQQLASPYDELWPSGLKPILVTGAPRSGTTWLGRSIARSPFVAYHHEMFRPKGVLRHLGVFDRHFLMVDSTADEPYRALMERVLGFGIRRGASLRGTVRTSTRNLLFGAARRVAGVPRPLLKEPMAFFSAEWLASVFDMNVVVAIRHPAAFCASMKRLEWRMDFRHFTDQPRLVERYLDSHRALLENPVDDPIWEFAVLWLCINSVAEKLKRRHPEWVFVRHEDLCLEPVEGFRRLYAALGLPFSAGIRRAIEQSVSSRNPVDAPGNVAHHLQRDGRGLVNSWRSKLAPAELELIRTITGDAADDFYSDSWW